MPFAEQDGGRVAEQATALHAGPGRLVACFCPAARARLGLRGQQSQHSGGPAVADQTRQANAHRHPDPDDKPVSIGAGPQGTDCLFCWRLPLSAAEDATQVDLEARPPPPRPSSYQGRQANRDPSRPRSTPCTAAPSASAPSSSSPPSARPSRSPTAPARRQAVDIGSPGTEILRFAWCNVRSTMRLICSGSSCDEAMREPSRGLA